MNCKEHFAVQLKSYLKYLQRKLGPIIILYKYLYVYNINIRRRTISPESSVQSCSHGNKDTYLL